MDQIRVGNGQGLNIMALGNALYPSLVSSKLHFENVLHVHALTKSLLYINKFTRDNSCFFEFWSNYFLVKDQKTMEILL